MSLPNGLGGGIQMERCERDPDNFKEHLAYGLRTQIPQLKKTK